MVQVTMPKPYIKYKIIKEKVRREEVDRRVKEDKEVYSSKFTNPDCCDICQQVCTDNGTCEQYG
jgi:hypothetical protein